MNVKGQQVLLLNEFDKQSNWYKMLNVEAKIRVIAQMCPNSYQLAFFACCREIYDKSYHFGVIKDFYKDNMDKTEEEVEDIVNQIAAKQQAARGNTAIGDVMKRQNFALCFGCKPSEGVLADTQMVKDVLKILVEDFDRVTFTVQFVSCFDDLKGSDANFEMIQSNTIQPVRLEYKDNFATKTLAVLFAFNKCKDLTYAGAMDRQAAYKKLFEETLNFD